MVGGIKKIFRRIHHSIPPEIRKSYRFLVILMEKFRRHLIPLYQCDFKERESGESMRILYVGWDQKMLHYWLDRFSEEEAVIKRLSWMTRGKICRLLRRNPVEIEIIMVESFGVRDRCRWKHGFLLPHWMEMQVEMDAFQRKSRTKNIIRNIRKHHLKYEVRKGMSDFDLFYHRMYVPFVRIRHGLSSDIADYKHFAGKFRNEESMLFFIIVENEPVAAAYIEEKGGIHRLSAFGVLDGNEDVFRLGVVGALYYFVVQYFKDIGEASLLVGNSKPVVLDGVSEFKRQIGGAPYLKDLPRQQKLWFIPRGRSQVMKYILKSNPLYHLKDGTLQMAVFLEDRDFTDQEEFYKFFKRLNIEQVDSAVIYCFDHPRRLQTWLKGQSGILIMDVSEVDNLQFPINP